MSALATQYPLTATFRPDRARRLGPRGVVAVVLAGQALASLDTAIVNVAAPDMQRDLHLSGAALQLVVYAYLLSYAAGLITAARLGARRGFGGVFTAGVALFTASSLAWTGGRRNDAGRRPRRAGRRCRAAGGAGPVDAADRSRGRAPAPRSGAVRNGAGRRCRRRLGLARVVLADARCRGRRAGLVRAARPPAREPRAGTADRAVPVRPQRGTRPAGWRLRADELLRRRLVHHGDLPAEHAARFRAACGLDVRRLRGRIRHREPDVGPVAGGPARPRPGRRLRADLGGHGGAALASRGPWHWYATASLAAAGAGHGAGFGGLVRRAAAQVNPRHAASLSGLLATVNQLAIAVGVATAGMLYLTFVRIGHGAHALGPVLLVIAAVEALSGATVTVLLARRSAISIDRQDRA